MNSFVTAFSYDTRAHVNTRVLKGPEGVAAEVLNRLTAGFDTCPRSFFRRACKRKGASQTEARALLRKMGIFHPLDNFPMALMVTEPVYLSYETWSERGYQVKRGATSYARALSSGRALFNEFQVVRKGGEL